MLNCRIFPNGEFSVWGEKKTTAVEPPPESPDYLGLSLLPNSHRVALGLAEPPPERAKRGSRGISRHGARMVRNAAFLLQQSAGMDRLTFATFTLPAFSASEQFLVALSWGEIVRKFIQSLGRLLAAAGLSKSVVGCTEIQMKRYKASGGMPLHLHLVFVGKKRGKSWAISPGQFRGLWSNAIHNEVPGLPRLSYSAAVDCQRVKKDVGSYLGKYMSKGAGALNLIIDDDPGIVDFLPSSWWICSLKLRRAVGRRITGGNGTALKIMRDIRSGDTRIFHAQEVKVVLRDGSQFVAAVVGKLTAEGRNMYAFKEGRIPQPLN